MHGFAVVYYHQISPDQLWEMVWAVFFVFSHFASSAEEERIVWAEDLVALILPLELWAGVLLDW